jgi:murein DD-endopeptidase MepM/ murein hydrolase activator NlpD
MPRSRWTVMLVPHDNERVRSWQLSARTLRSAATGGVAAILLFTFVGIFLFARGGTDLRAAHLRSENRLLAAEVEHMRAQVAVLNESLDSLATHGREYRVIAGLPVLSSDIQRVGVGGPGTRRVAPLMYLNSRMGRRVEETSNDIGTLNRRARLLQSSLNEAFGTLRANRERLASIPTVAPASGPLTSLFSPARHHPVLHITRPHKGIDIAAAVGEPILAPARGRVVFAGNRSNGYGNMVEIDHGFGYITRFAHASRLLVHTGQIVRRGDVIALVGATGLVTGPHLHYEVEVNGQQVDPLNFIITDAIPD